MFVSTMHRGEQLVPCPRMKILQDQVHQEGWTFEGLGKIPCQLTQGEDEGVQTASDLL